MSVARAAGRKEVPVSPVVDTHQEILYPLDFSYKILSQFEGEFDGVLSRPRGAVLTLCRIASLLSRSPPHVRLDVVQEKPRPRNPKDEPHVRYCAFECCIISI